MKIFLSYPSDERDTAERLNFALVEQGHDVFFDRADLPAGFEFDQRIASAIAASDLIVFLITPTAVTPGRYTLTEMKLAEERWPKPSGRTLPVMLRPTEFASIPGYLRAVNIFTPRGNAVAEIANEVRKLAGGVSLTTRIGHRLRSPAGLGLAVAIVALSAFAWTMWPWNATPRRRSVTLPLAIRQHARAAAAMADSGFVIATSNPPQLVRFSESGAQVGEPVDLMGDPVSVTRTPGNILVATRGRDGVMVFDSKRLRLADSVILDPTTVAPPYRSVSPPRRSGDIQSVAVYRNDLWVTTGDRDGEPTVLRYRQNDSKWDVPTFTADTAGFGPEANGVRLRWINGDLWGVRARGEPSILYHFLGFIRIDRFDGKDRAIVRCAHDVAPAPPTNLLLLSCDNELQEIYADASTFTLVRTRPTLPPDRTPGTTSYDLLERDSTNVIVALSTTGAPPNDKPVRARVAEVDSAGIARPLLDVADAVVQSLGVTSRSVVVVLRRADGSTDVEVAPRKR